jgi:hypothetical protein
MKPIQKDELYENLSNFLKSKGVELTEGSYTKGVHAGCSLLADAINMSQAGLERARLEVEKKLEQVRQVIHQKSAPKAQPAPPTQNAAPTATEPVVRPRPKSRAQAGKRSARKAARRKTK